MKAAVFRGKHDLRFEEVSVPAIGPEDVLVRVAYCGICGSDIHTFHGMQANVHSRPPGPRVLGHEVSGTVAEVDASVTAYQPGDRVTCIPWLTCGICAYCRRGLVNHCPRKTLLGGAMAELVAAPQGTVYRLPDDLTLRRAALAEPLSCCVWVMDLAELRSGETAVVIGAGTMGLLLSLLARADHPRLFHPPTLIRSGRPLALDPGSRSDHHPRLRPRRDRRGHGVRGSGQGWKSAGDPGRRMNHRARRYSRLFDTRPSGSPPPANSKQ